MSTGDGLADLDPLDFLADEFVARYRRGKRSALADHVEAYPELALAGTSAAFAGRAPRPSSGADVPDEGRSTRQSSPQEKPEDFSFLPAVSSRSVAVPFRS